MPTPPKPFSVLKAENKSHRTKAELRQREEEEKALSSNVKIKEAREVRENKIAHDKFKRVTMLLGEIDKHDAIYETVINRYCLLYAETLSILEEREQAIELMQTLKTEYHAGIDRVEDHEKAKLVIQFTKAFGECMATINKIDAILANKRKMLLDIEKENVMTIAAALRSIPKKVEEKKGQSLKDILGG